MVRKVLLGCGIASSLLYILLNVAAAVRYPGYDSGGTLTDQLDLVWAGIAVLFMFLFIAFGAGAFDKRFQWIAGLAVVLIREPQATSQPAARRVAPLAAPTRP